MGIRRLIKEDCVIDRGPTAERQPHSGRGPSRLASLHRSLPKSYGKTNRKFGSAAQLPHPPSISRIPRARRSTEGSIAASRRDLRPHPEAASNSRANRVLASISAPSPAPEEPGSAPQQTPSPATNTQPCSTGSGSRSSSGPQPEEVGQDKAEQSRAEQNRALSGTFGPERSAAAESPR